MTLSARIIACLDVNEGRVVKGVNFTDLIDAGDPVEMQNSTTLKASMNLPSWISLQVLQIVRLPTMSSHALQSKCLYL